MVEYENIKGQCMAMSLFSRCTLEQARYVADTLATGEINTVGIFLNPVINGPVATQLVPIDAVSGLSPNDKLNYEVVVEMEGDLAKINCGRAFRNLFPANPWGAEMLLDEIKYQKRFGFAEVERLQKAVADAQQAKS